MEVTVVYYDKFIDPKLERELKEFFEDRDYTWQGSTFDYPTNKREIKFDKED